ncbi:hypothetical protein ACFQIC_13355 [Halobacillus seohaensis]|uniref:AP2/ERF domain-containing protein n=1 Tax=Halobacillus seohaensis TaxID=447421 RepID=A0ABW2EN01_9BACI
MLDTILMRFPFYKGVTKVDADDYIKLELYKYRWLQTKNQYVYARDSDNKKNIHLHRLILRLSDEDKRWGDHIEHDTLDNRKSELRSVEPKHNNYNRRKNKTQKYKGVSDKRGKHRAQIRINKKKEHFGSWKTEELAAYAYDCIANKVYGQFAHTNNVDYILSETDKKIVEEYAAAKLDKLKNEEESEQIELKNTFIGSLILNETYIEHR